MKYRVIGWTDYEEFDIEGDSCSTAAYLAIVDDIKANGYCFSGYAHQEYWGGVPVLNDGKKRRFRQRSWGGVMAKAHGYNGSMDYALFAFAFRDLKSEKMPPIDKWITADQIVAETDLNEEFTVKASESVFEKAERELVYLDYDLPELRYLDIGDTLTLESDGKRASYRVTDLERGWDRGEGKGIADPIFGDELHRILYCGDADEKAKAEDLCVNGKKVLSVRLEKK